jgi:hypothetical protein
VLAVISLGPGPLGLDVMGLPFETVWAPDVIAGFIFDSFL